SSSLAHTTSLWRKADVIAQCSTCRQNVSLPRKTRKERCMTPSPKPRNTGRARSASDDLPPALSSMWRLCKLGYRHEPGLMFAAFVLALLAALPDALLALWFKMLGEGVLTGNYALVRGAAIALGVSAAATWFLRTISTRVQR